MASSAGAQAVPGDHGTPGSTQDATTESSPAKMNGVDIQILDELRRLNKLQVQLASEPPLKSQAIWNFILQGFGLVMATLFGAFAILAWQAADQANSIANEANTKASTANRLAESANGFAMAANQLALVGWCQTQTQNNTAGNNDNNNAVPANISALCSSIQSAASVSIFNYASRYWSITRNVYLTTVTESRLSTSISITVVNTVTGAPAVSTAITTSFSIVSTLRTTRAVLTTETFGTYPTSTSSPNSGSSAGGNIGAIAGAAVGGVCGLALLVGGLYLPYSSYKARKDRNRRIKQTFSLDRPHTADIDNAEVIQVDEVRVKPTIADLNHLRNRPSKAGIS